MCDCEATLEFLQIRGALPTDTAKLEETARLYLGPINTAIDSNERTIWLDAKPAVYVPH